MKLKAIMAEKELKPIIKHMNYITWYRVSVFLEVFLAISFGLSVFDTFTTNMILINIVAMLAGTINLIITRKASEEGKIYYVSMMLTVLLMLVGSILGCVIFIPESPMALYYCLLLGCSAILFLTPIKLVLLNILLSGFAIFVICMNKSGDALKLDIFMCCFMTIVSIAFNINILYSKIESIVYVQKLAKEYEDNKKKTSRHISALASLSSEYQTVIYADLAKDEILDVYATGRAGFGENLIGKVYSDMITNFSNDIVYIEDSQTVKNSLSIAAVKETLENSPSASARYRIEENGLQVYYELKVIKGDDKESEYPVIIASRNVDVEVRLDMVFQANFDDAKRNATKDLMTGVKNKGAFEGKCQELMQGISDGKHTDFAIVMCDVNGLKKVNDTIGHEAGDKLIKDVCHIVSTIYSHSPVYRIGGDEFVAVLTGSDYNDRDELLQMARNMAVNNDKGVSFASGMGVYDITVDKDVREVFNRADAAMYENKVAMKACRED